MEVLLFPLVLPVFTIPMLTVVQRRFGHRLGGRLAGFPTTTFPLLLALVLLDGAEAAAQAAKGIVAGQLVFVAFCLGYGRLGRWARTPVVVALVVAAAAFSVADSSAWPVTLAVAIAGLVTWPAPDHVESTPIPRWDAPVRVLVTVAVLAGLAVVARFLGPHLAGLLSCIPVVLTILASSTHRRSGFPAAESLVRGALRSAPATLTFAVVVAFGLTHFGPVVAFGAAVAGMIVVDQVVGQVSR
ncbi:hypothetical protein [Lentzea sp. NPDC051838]|uniref:hypothetical protein n=1 Tax=Lentzea sp. NPDC051838 TaxID=3154849 RepID=UPI0034226C92